MTDEETRYSDDEVESDTKKKKLSGVPSMQRSVTEPGTKFLTLTSLVYIHVHALTLSNWCPSQIKPLEAQPMCVHAWVHLGGLSLAKLAS